MESISNLKRVHFRWMAFDFADRVDVTEFSALKGISAVEAQNGHLRFRVTGELDEVVKTAAKHHVTNLEYREPNLEEIFLEYYGEKKSSSDHRDKPCGL